MQVAATTTSSTDLDHELSSDLRAAVNRLSRRLRAEKADSDITDGQNVVLARISLHGPQTLSQLAEYERVTLPSMTRTVNALVAADYIRREPSDDDRRKVFFALTDPGDALVTETRRRRDEWLFVRLAKLTDDERRILAAAAPVLRGLSD
jgi:DNA-binding MarR family transcriptional regulator